METLKPFFSFGQHFCANSFAIHVTYREAIFLSLQVCLFVGSNFFLIKSLYQSVVCDSFVFSCLHVFICVYQEAAIRCEKQFSVCLEDRDELLKQMLDWAFGGFQPTGPEILQPIAAINGRNS